MLPSHAQTSNPTEFSDDAASFQDVVQNSPVSLFISETYAGRTRSSDIISQIYINTENSPIFNATVLLTIAMESQVPHYSLYSATGIIGSSPVSLVFQSGCDDFEINSHTIEVLNAGNTASVTLIIDGQVSSTGELNPGADIPSDPGPCLCSDPLPHG